ncbi:hypothetical protein [Nocardia sp. 348MFTsu5.1]|uniref:hypothetical protein n=1 Tax=Nocardia sp. 348MFTsu5.1 TaxID=1172185 RepID=UPI00037DAA58|nr:hypothetical protein [Nocardia sp. 348MFTsu5.1]
MLVLALAATLVGFVLLAAALLSGVLWLAIACVVVCVIGVGFLIGDLLGLGPRSSAATESDADDDDAAGRDAGTDVNDDEVGTSDQEQDGDWSAAADQEEDPASGDSSEDHSQPAESNDDPGSDTDTREIPRISDHDRRDDPPTEEMFPGKPR